MSYEAETVKPGDNAHVEVNVVRTWPKRHTAQVSLPNGDAALLSTASLFPIPAVSTTPPLQAGQVEDKMLRGPKK